MSRSARLYLLHVALLTLGLAIWGLFYNIAVLALGYPREFLGLLNSVATGVAALLSLPLWWLVTRIGLRPALLAHAAVQAGGALVFALWPAALPLVVSAAVVGASTVLFEVSAQPFMIRHSDANTRDPLFSTNAALRIGIGGVGSLVAGLLPGLLAPLAGAPPAGANAYRATFAVAGVIAGLSLVPLLLARESRAEDAESRDMDKPDSRGMQAHNDQTRPAPTGLDVLPATPPATPHPPWRSLVARPGLVVRLLLPLVVVSAGAALLIPYLNLFFKERFAVDDRALGLVFAGLGIITGLATLAGPRIARRAGRVRAIVLTQLLSLPFLLLLGFVPLFWAAAGAALARAALYNMGWPLYDAFALEQVDERARPILAGLINGAMSAGYIVMPPLSVWIQARYGFTPLFVVTAVCYALASLFVLVFFARD